MGFPLVRELSVYATVFKYALLVNRDARKGIDKGSIQAHTQLFGRDVFRCAETIVQLHGLEDLVPGPAMICPNHTSSLDIPAVFLLPGRHYFGAKKELFSIPVFGPSLHGVGMYVVDRSRPRTAVESLHQACAHLKGTSSSSVEDSSYIVLFPEGTRNHQELPLQDFKRGPFKLALDHALPIVPVAIHGAADVMPKGSFLMHPGRIDIQVMPALMTGSYVRSSDGLSRLLEDTRTSVLEGLRKAQDYRFT